MAGKHFQSISRAQTKSSNVPLMCFVPFCVTDSRIFPTSSTFAARRKRFKHQPLPWISKIRYSPCFWADSGLPCPVSSSSTGAVSPRWLSEEQQQSAGVLVTEILSPWAETAAGWDASCAGLLHRCLCVWGVCAKVISGVSMCNVFIYIVNRL